MRPIPASTLRVNPKGSMTKQVTATTMRKRRRTRIRSTVNLPADAVCPYAHTTRRCTRASSSAAPGGELTFRMRGAQELRGMNVRPVPACWGSAGLPEKPTPRVYTCGRRRGKNRRGSFPGRRKPALSYRFFPASLQQSTRIASRVREHLIAVIANCLAGRS